MTATKSEIGEQKNSKYDWEGIKNKIDSLQESLNQKIKISPEEKRAILKTRAQSLAMEIKDESAQKDFIEIIEFSLAYEKYGIETSFCREVYPLKDFTILPGVPSFVIGIINIRGQIISVIDLKRFFNLPEKGLGELNKVIVLRNEQIEFGILADVILGTRSVAVDELQSSPISAIGIGAEYLKGITGDHTIILDSEKILRDEKIIVHQEAE
ncbi:MAG: purine-binding chemotaxis protein CheW [Stygiobacter sp.]|nr:MAG: purine-binding chemotaxis protein CheW [Stygiobacter sp.]KAF0215581.1 MAG: purine-binding chemotaxis protein [Ignavibacteria bacterium]